jgi:hypothetical protein
MNHEHRFTATFVQVVVFEPSALDETRGERVKVLPSRTIDGFVCERFHRTHHSMPSIRQFKPLPIPKNPTRSSLWITPLSSAMAAVIGSDTEPILPR